MQYIHTTLMGGDTVVSLFLLLYSFYPLAYFIS